IADRTEAIRLAPTLPEAWYARGSAYYILGRYAEAKHDLEQAVQLQPDYALAKNVLEKTEEKLASQAKAPIAQPATAAVARRRRPPVTAPSTGSAPIVAAASRPASPEINAVDRQARDREAAPKEQSK